MSMGADLHIFEDDEIIIKTDRVNKKLLLKIQSVSGKGKHANFNTLYIFIPEERVSEFLEKLKIALGSHCDAEYWEELFYRFREVE